MTRFVGDDSPQSRMLIARNAAELVLYGLREIAVVFDREGVAAMIRQAIFRIYRALDAGPDSLVQPEALSQASALLEEAQQLLARSAARPAFQLERARDILRDARDHTQAASEAIAISQLDRRLQLPFGYEETARQVAPFRASLGRPQLHAPRRAEVSAHVDLGQAQPEPPAEVKVTLSKMPESLDDLKAMARDLFSVAKEFGKEEEPEEERSADDNDAPSSTLSGGAEDLAIAEFARDAIEDIAALGGLRHPIDTESWLDQAPFEQRLLNRLDHFCSFGSAGISAAVLYHAESETPDSDRAFALAFALGCIDGVDTIDAIVGTIRQAAPEEFPGFIEGLVLATNPHVEGAMRLLLGMNEPKLVMLAVNVLSQRGRLTEDDVEWAQGAGEPGVELLLARALGRNLPAEKAVVRLDKLYAKTEPGSDLHLTAVESGLRRGQASARQELRHLLTRPHQGTARAAALLGLSGSARDLELLLGAAQAEPSALTFEGLGRLGHVGALPLLLSIVDGQDEALAPAAAKELERVTGAGLIDEVEEPWVKELPPEAAELDVPIPMKKVRRVSTDPARWRAWERANAQRFEPLKKYRRGQPFLPALLLAELEAKEPRPEERERSALELSIATGRDFGFRADDWVLAQQQAMAAMTEYFERHGYEAGSFCYAGAGITARPERKADVERAKAREAEAMPFQYDFSPDTPVAEPDLQAPPLFAALEEQADIPAFLRASTGNATPTPRESSLVIGQLPSAVAVAPPVTELPAYLLGGTAPILPPVAAPPETVTAQPSWVAQVPAAPLPVLAPVPHEAAPPVISQPTPLPAGVLPVPPSDATTPAPVERPTPPATFFESDAPQPVPGLKPLKKLPWEN